MSIQARKTPVRRFTVDELFLEIKAGFVRQGTSFTQWCRENDVDRQNARVAILGGWRGPKASALIEKITKAAGVELPQESQP